MLRPPSRSFLSIAVVILTFLIAFALPLGSPGQGADEDLQACCFPDGSCEDCDPEKCSARGGTPQGYGTCCDCTECPQPTQACCFDDGSCLGLTVEACASEGGTPQGEGTDCSPNPCSQPTQACCYDDGRCRELPVDECLGDGGTPQAEGTDCFPNPCPQPTQACCYDDGRCRELPVDECLGDGGTPQGEGTDCSPNPCPQPTQACCFENGICKDLDVASCSSEGGEPQGAGTNCAHTRCPQPAQACCFLGGSCQDLQVESCLGMGGISQGEGSCCRRIACQAHPLVEIQLTSPAPGEALAPGGSFCWEGLGLPGVTYTVISRTQNCDPEVLSRPHPFAPLIPDPEAENARRKRVDEILRRKAGLRTSMTWSDYCGHQLLQLRKLTERVDGKPSVLEGLEARRQVLVDAWGDAIYNDSEDYIPEFDVPTQCTRDLGLPQFDDIEPGDCEACEEFADRLSQLVSILMSLQAKAEFGESWEFERLLRRWKSGAEHRGVFGFYGEVLDLINDIGDALSFGLDLLDVLTDPGSAEDAITGVIEDYIGGFDQDLRDALNAATEAADKLSLLVDLIRSGAPTPAFLVEMTKAMFDAIGKAVKAATDGWKWYALVMATEFQKGYQDVLCAIAAVEEAAAQRDRIAELCALCQSCSGVEIVQINRGLEQIIDQKRSEVETRQAYWQEQQLLIATQMRQMSLSGTWFGKCCTTSGTRTVKVPSEAPCADQLEEALKQALGDKACFLRFSCTLSGCEWGDDGNVQTASVNCSFSPQLERRPDCCVPSRTTETPLGTKRDPGRQGEICHRPERTPETGSWGVEGRDQAGDLIASSAQQGIQQKVVSEPAPIPLPAPLPSGCACSIAASIDGMQITPGDPILRIQQGTMLNIAAVGDCSPDCAAGTQSISIQPPLVAPAWFANPIALMPLPVAVSAPSVAYDFPDEGTYTIMVTQFCEDGQECTYTFNVDAVGTPSPVPRQPRTDEESSTGTCPSCGSDRCIELAYQHTQEPPMIPMYDHTLTLQTHAVLDLVLSSTCRLDCETDRRVRWEMTTPAGGLDVFEDTGLYQVTYSFAEIGQYALCTIETALCPEGELRFENWWIVEVESPD